jgi:hypothetical protein
MSYRTPLVALALLCPLLTVRADSFDQYVNATLSKAAESPDARELQRLTSKEILENDRVLPGVPAAVLIVKTNEGRWAKLTVQSARQKIDAEKALPMLLVERYVTYKEGEERTVQSSGHNVSLFPGFRLSLDLGQVVPEQLGGDLRFVVDGDKLYTEPVGKARLFVLTKAVEFAAAKPGPKLVVGETFEPRYFNGTFKLHDDGRRSGTLKLQVTAEGDVTGSYYSDKDGSKYEVRGKVGSPAHSIRFTVVFPRSEQMFQGMLFTGDGKAMAGTSRIADREAAFYAVRVEE